MPDRPSVVRATVPPRRSLWIVVVTPLCVGFSTLHLLGAIVQVHHAALFLVMGLALGAAYLWIFLQNLFARQEVYFDRSAITATSRLLFWRRVRSYPVHEIRQINYLCQVSRGEPCIRLTLEGRKVPISVLRGLADGEATRLFSSINRSLPLLASKLSLF